MGEEDGVGDFSGAALLKGQSAAGSATGPRACRGLCCGPATPAGCGEPGFPFTQLQKRLPRSTLGLRGLSCLLICFFVAPWQEGVGEARESLGREEGGREVAP